MLGVLLLLFRVLSALAVFSINIGHDLVQELLGLRLGLLDGITELIVIFATVDHLLDYGVPVVEFR